MSRVEIKTEKGLVKKLRTIRDKMNEDMQDMTYQEVKEYLQLMKEGKITYNAAK